MILSGSVIQCERSNEADDAAGDTGTGVTVGFGASLGLTGAKTKIIWVTVKNETTSDNAVWAVQIGESIGLLVVSNTLGVGLNHLEVTNVTTVTVIVSSSVISAIRVVMAASRGATIA